MRRTADRSGDGGAGSAVAGPAVAAGRLPAAASPAHRHVLGLQATCGNRAVQRLLASGEGRTLPVQRYELAHVPYTGNERSWQAVAMRAASPQGLKNIASIKVTGRDLATASSIPPGPKGVTPKHSEQVVWEMVAPDVMSGKSRIEWVYTEREPCGKGPGMKNCALFLDGLLRQYGAAGDKTPVYYSFNYPSPQEVRSVAQYYVDQKVVDNWDDAYDAAYDLWLQEHGDTKRMIAEAQQMFGQPGPWGAGAFKK